jgi:argininosuccinate lyase
MYLYLHDEVDYFLSEISNLILNLKTQSTKYSQTPCPGFTHYQPATVTSFGKILDAFKSMFERDLLKLKHLKETYNFSPLGAVTGYSTTLDIDPNITAAELGYKNIFKNSIDVITNRGEFEMTFANCLSGFLIHASMMAQTFIIFSTQQFGYIVLPDEFTTGSSVMPQKKNPDALEIIKSKSAGAIGVTTAIQSILSASFIGYNRDTQEIKYKIMSLLEDCKYIPYILSKIVRNLKVNKQKMLEETQKYFINSTEVMESLMKKSKLPMRKSKEIIEMAINESIKENSLDKITKSALEKSLKKARIYRIMELEVFLK